MSLSRIAVPLVAVVALATGCSTGGTKAESLESAAQTEASSDARAIAVDLEGYFVDNDSYPADQAQFDTEVAAERTDLRSVFEYTYLEGADGDPGSYTLCATNGGAYALYDPSNSVGESVVETGLGIACP